MHRVLCLSICVLLCGVSPAAAQEELIVEGVVGVTPAGATAGMAVRVSIEAGRAVAGVRWYNSDGGVLFPELRIYQTSGGQFPGADDLLHVVRGVSGASLAWSVVAFDEPVHPSTDEVFVVFQLPAFLERSGEGQGGGPGIGFGPASGTQGYLSADGTDWVGIEPSLSLAVELILEPVGGSPFEEEGSGESALAASHSTELLPPSPNPSNPSTTIAFSLAAPGQVRITVHDLRGRRVATLQDGHLTSGLHRLEWAGVDGSGKSVASGTYVVRLSTAEQVFRQRVTIVQ